MNPRALYWLDLETTGLDPQRDQILEIGIARVPFSDPFDLPTIILRECLRFRDWSGVDPAVIDMHHKSGLMIECMHSIISSNPEESDLNKRLDYIVDEQLKTFGDDWSVGMGSEELPVLAGSSVHFDREFLREHLPRISGLFSHRYFDVSAIKLLCRSLGMPVQPKGEKHRVLDDIKESIQHAKECVRWLREYAPTGVFLAPDDADVSAEVRAHLSVGLDDIPF